MEVVIIGAGIGGLTLGADAARAGIPCRIYEAAPEIKPLGVGINILPHATRELCELGLEDALASVAVIDARDLPSSTASASSSTASRSAAAPATTAPQFSIHRGDLQMVLLDAFVERAGADASCTGRRCTASSRTSRRHRAFRRSATAQPLDRSAATSWSSCDGIHSVHAQAALSATKASRATPASTCGAA